MNATRKRLLLASGLALLTLLAVQGLVWVEASVTDWERKAKGQETIQREVTDLAARLKANRASGKNQPAGKPSGETVPSLLPWLEKESAAFQLTDKMQQIAPIPAKGNDGGGFREKADLTLKAITMETATRFLHRLESVPQIRIIRGDIKRGEKDAAGISLSLEIGLL
ncbi:MAG: hypothetical protein HQM02_10540 [Magnetococcales bacterium]|nr:hypothetical protein [Magnetococcales bacterium]